MILVTGATGNVGRHVVELLAGAGQDVRAVTRDPAAARLPDGIDIVAGDLRRPGTLPSAFDGVERAFLFPVHGHLDGFLEIARRAGLDLVVLLSSSAVTERHPNEMARAHLASEQAVARSGLPWTAVRPAAFMANDLRWAPQITAGGVVRAPYPAAATAPIDERDIAAVAVGALLGDAPAGHAYTLTGPESLTQIERVERLAEVLGRPLRIEEQAPAGFRQTSGLPPPVADGLLTLLAARVGTTADVTGTVQEVTGHQPHTYRQWAARHAAEFTGGGWQ